VRSGNLGARGTAPRSSSLGGCNPVTETDPRHFKVSPYAVPGDGKGEWQCLHYRVRTKHNLVKRLEQLGFRVTLEPAPGAA